MVVIFTLFLNGLQVFLYLFGDLGRSGLHIAWFRFINGYYVIICVEGPGSVSTGFTDS